MEQFLKDQNQQDFFVHPLSILHKEKYSKMLFIFILLKVIFSILMPTFRKLKWAVIPVSPLHDKNLEHEDSYLIN